MRAKLYSLSLSHPTAAARLMLERKGVEVREIELIPGIHPAQLWMRGLWAGKVPVVAIAGERIQGSTRISRRLDELVPDPPLFPGDPGMRAKVEEAERWGEAEFQSVPRRMFRWGAARDRTLRRWIAREAGLPAANVLSEMNVPIAHVLARVEGGSNEGVQRTLDELPGQLGRIDAYIADGVIGGDDPNAADFQILTAVRVLLTFADLREFTERHACADLAMAIWPEAAGPVKPFLPPAWLEPVR